MKPHKFRVGERVKVVLEGRVVMFDIRNDPNSAVKVRFETIDSTIVEWLEHDHIRPIPRRRKKESTWVSCRHGHENLRSSVNEYGEGKCPQCGLSVKPIKSPKIGVD